MNLKSSMAHWSSSFWRNVIEVYEKNKVKVGFQNKDDEHQIDDFAHIFRQKTRSELVRISAAVMGIEFCYAAETAFVSPTLLKIGVRHSHLSLIWCLSPLIGFFMTPILGSLSDRCNSRLGKRRPFILGLSVGIILGLILVPNGKDIGIALGDWYSCQDSGFDTNNTSSDNGQANNSGPLISPATHRGENPVTMTSTGETDAYHSWGIFFTVVGTVLLDFDADACQSPSRAYLLDITLAEDHAIGLSTFTIMAGLGGSLGYAMGAINWDVTSFGKKLGGQVRVVFTIILFIYVICVMITVFSFQEIPLHVSDREKKLGNGQNTTHLPNSQKSVKKTRKSVSRLGHYKKFVDEDVVEEDEEEEEEKEECKSNKTSICHSRMHNEKPVRLNESVHHSKNYGSMQEDNGSPCICEENSEETSFISSADFGASDATPSIAWQKLPVPNTNQNGDAILKIQSEVQIDFDAEKEPIVELKHYLYSIIFMPKSLRVLCLTNLFSWMSLVAYSLYFTDFVGEAVYKGDPRAVDGSFLKLQYEDGVRFGCLGMSLYSLSCSIYSLTIDKLIQTFGARPVYIGGHWVYSFGMLMLALSRHRAAVILLSCTSGVMYATLFTMPYVLVAHYHTNNMFDDKVVQSKTQIRGLGTDIAVVSSMLFLAQFTLSICVGPLVNLIGSTVAIVFIASFLSFCGGLCATQVMYFDL